MAAADGPQAKPVTTCCDGAASDAASADLVPCQADQRLVVVVLMASVPLLLPKLLLPPLPNSLAIRVPFLCCDAASSAAVTVTAMGCRASDAAAVAACAAPPPPPLLC